MTNEQAGIIENPELWIHAKHMGTISPSFDGEKMLADLAAALRAEGYNVSVGIGEEWPSDWSGFKKFRRALNNNMKKIRDREWAAWDAEQAKKSRTAAQAAVDAAKKSGWTPQYSSSSRDFLSGDDERDEVDSILGPGAYDSPFTSDDEILDVLSR